MSTTVTDYGDVITIWEHGLPNTQWRCPECNSQRVHLTSDGRGIICYRTRNCGYAPFVSYTPSNQAIFDPQGETTP